jgi:serine/threonine protein kinase
LSDLPTPLENIGLIRKILDQLVSVVRDGLHRDGRVCHRDLKAENILINE